MKHSLQRRAAQHYAGILLVGLFAAAAATLSPRAWGALTVTKTFSPSTIAANGTTTLSIQIDNPNQPANGVAFTDTYPANVQNAAAPSVTNTCTNGIVTAAGGGNSLQLTGAQITANGTCTVTVQVTATAAGSYANSVTVTSQNRGSGSSSATLAVTAISASNSTVVASPTSVPADGTTTSTITVTLKDGAGNPVSGKTVTLAAGSGSSTISPASGPSNASGVVTFTVKDSVAESVTYTATDTTDGIAITQTATVTFTVFISVSSFNAVEPGANAVTGKIFTKIAGQNFALDIVALDASNAIATGFTGTVVVEVVDNTSGGACSGLPLIAAFTNQTFVSGDAGRHPLTSPNTVPNVYRNAKVRIKYPTSSPTVISCSGDNFAIRPASLSFSVTDANRTTAGTTNALNNTAISGTTVHNAGRPFTISATGFNGAGTPAVTSNYNGSPTAVLTTCGGTACTGTTGTLTPGTWSASGGTVTTTTASYSDVGAFTLQLQDSTFAAVDSGDGTPAAQLTISSTATGAGRFVPDRFLVSATSITPRSDIACPGSSFTYMNERMDAKFTLTAVNASGATTTLYTGSLARLDLTNPSSFSFGAIDGGPPVTVLGGRLNTSLGSSGTWGSGVASVVAVISVNRNASPDGPFASFKLGIAPSDPDSVALDPAALNLDADNDGINERALVGTSAVRFGRLRLLNSLGSEKLDLPVTMRAEYFSGGGFVTNTSDNCTAISAANISLGNYVGNLNGTNMGASHISVGGAFASGVGSLTLTKPSPTASGSVDVTANLGAAGMSYLLGSWTGSTYTENPTARGSFGTFGTGVPGQFIFFRENF
jgi:MSHA biogenesis protein MshQ